MARVDVPRYLGTWYEIATIPQRFQRGCVGVTAHYSLRDDGAIDVVNVCRKGTLDGKERSVRGKAWIVDRTTNAKLKVRFFWPFYGRLLDHRARRGIPVGRRRPSRPDLLLDPQPDSPDGPGPLRRAHPPGRRQGLRHLQDQEDPPALLNGGHDTRSSFSASPGRGAIGLTVSGLKSLLKL
ncbi:MAG: lipocalin family protein [Ignavibacteriales bacterium]|nr:lipocalin family protein [Ignavibacteriales bacterium]